ncbi:TonB-dependent receptor [Dyadobacter sp. CY261]|uniref:outer membrane beta-barrel family protein n=1 Tax=Dyadobacter sp. CY261 TaxID=2907203 RepID=UPI001F31D481|nr:outer membrane beta-barrel family protein [Dyadobacter sp. CY261]MCF0072898.1 TonB-dependent receptor [Dyadobacter sp. CY261]
MKTLYILPHPVFRVVTLILCSVLNGAYGQTGAQPADTVYKNEPRELDELLVRGIKPVFEQQGDRMVLNLGSSLSSSGNTLLEILQKSPGVTVNRQSGSILMNGRAGVQLMINGKMVQVAADAAIQMLAGMSAANVERIELIHTPGARYDAEGNAGIIHIMTKSNAELGTSGSAGLTLGMKGAENFGTNFTLHHRGQRRAWFADYSLVRDGNLHTMLLERKAANDAIGILVMDKSRRKNVTVQQNLSAGLEWKMTNASTLNVGLTGYKRNWQLDAITNGINQLKPDSAVDSQIGIRESNVWQSFAAAVGVQVKLSPKSGIGAGVDYLYYHNDNPSDYDMVLFETNHKESRSMIDLSKDTPIRILVAKADFYHVENQSFSLEAGLKGVFSVLKNDVLVKRLEQSRWITDPDFSSHARLDETTGAIYISSKWQPVSQWQLSGGFRYEYTAQRLNQRNRHYGYLFPSFSATRMLGTEKEVQLSYARRITRPTYNDIAPYVFFWGTQSFSAGNTALLPAVSDAVRLGYRIGRWTVAAYHSHSANEIAFMQPEVDATGNLIMRSQNLAFLNSTGLTTAYAAKLASWWDVQCGLTTQYQAGKTDRASGHVRRKLYSANLNLTSIIQLPWQLAVEISGTHQSKTLSGISVFLPSGSLNAGIRKNFGQKASLKLAMDDILYTNLWRVSSNLPEQNLDLYFRYDWHNRFIRITFNRNFGNGKLKSVPLKSASDEERGRIN